MSRVGLLHTASVHVATFEALLVEALPGVETRHVVDPALLDDAGTDCLTERLTHRLTHRLTQRLREAGEGTDVVLCTCSTIGGLAERIDPQEVGAPVLRVDRPLAERAVALAGGGRVGLVTAVASTLAPTRRLVAEVAAAAGVGVALVDLPVAGAWALFEAGDLPGYHAAVAAHVRATAGDCDVVLLAQASMAPVVSLLDDLSVLASPVLAVEQLVRLLGRERAG